MNLIDNNCINHIFESQINCNDLYYLAPEVKDEAELAEITLNQSLPEKIILISDLVYFDETIYLDFYKKMINKHDGKSFFNMTGIGDISILATIHTLIELQTNKGQIELFDNGEIFVFTQDLGLRKRIKREFSTSHITIKSYLDIT